MSAAFGRSRSASTTRPSGSHARRGTTAPSRRPAAAPPTRPSASTRRPWARLACAPARRAPGRRTRTAPARPARGASSPRSSALQRRREENGTCPTTRRVRRPSASPASAIACSVRLRDGALAAYAASALRQRLARRPRRPGTSPTTRSVGSVSVPVLSVQTTSTDASDSTALSCCASTPRWAILKADTAAVRLMRRIRPSGTRFTIPAVSNCTRAAAVSTRAKAVTIRARARAGPRTRPATAAAGHWPARAGSAGAGTRARSSVSRAARLSGPTAVASNRRRALDRERARPHRLTGTANDELRLTRQVGLVQREPIRRHHRPIGDEPDRRPRDARGLRRPRCRPDAGGRPRHARRPPRARPARRAGRGPAWSGSPGTTRSRCSRPGSRQTARPSTTRR